MPDNVLREHAFERALPHSAEAERAILGAIILDNAFISQAIELLKPDDFYVPSYRKIFIAMINLFERGEEINPILIAEELKKENSLDTVGGYSVFSQIIFGLPHSTNITHYAKAVKGRSLLRRLITTNAKSTSEALEQEEEPEVILEHAERAIFELSEERIRGRLEPVEGIARNVLDKIQEMEGKTSVLLGLTTGFIDLDEKTGGLQKQELTIVAARPSMGKTAFSLMLAQNAALEDSKLVVAIFSLEMSKEALVMRLLCANGNIDAQRFRNGFLSRAEWGAVAKSLGQLADTKIFLDDTAAITVLEMRAKCQRLKAEQKRLDMIIVDYLQLMGGDANPKKRSESRQQEVSLLSRELKGLAKEFNVPVVALSQLSRAPELRSNHRPQLSDLRESGALEQDADGVWFLYREEPYLTAEKRMAIPDDRKNVAELIIAKQRNGPTDTIELRFIPSSMRFDSLYRENQPSFSINDWHDRN